MIFPPKLPLRELTEQALLQQISQVGALINSQGDILYLHGRTGRFLEPMPGEAGANNILKMAREGLRRELTTCLHKAVGKRTTVHLPGLRVKTNGDFSIVNLTIRPVPLSPASTNNSMLYLVILEEVAEDKAESLAGKDGPSAGAELRISKLTQELRIKEEYLQSSNEELETANEELKSFNEEMQSVNEELQSTNEELETSKEELQSVNEELTTVNGELQSKLAELTQANNDMNNLLAGTGIGTIFVDHQLHILRFTSVATRITNLIASDIGRPVGHIVSNLISYERFLPDIKSVLDTLIPVFAEVHATDGKWYSMQIQPYRTLTNVIEGAVITFVDITEKKSADKKFKTFFDTVNDAIVIHTEAGQLVEVNQRMLEMFQLSYEQALKLSIRDILSTDRDLQLEKEYYAGVMKGETVHFQWKVKRPGETESFDVEVILGSLDMEGVPHFFWNMREKSPQSTRSSEV